MGIPDAARVTLDPLDVLLRIQAGFAAVLHAERGHMAKLLFSECECREDAEQAVVSMTVEKAEARGEALEAENVRLVKECRRLMDLQLHHVGQVNRQVERTDALRIHADALAEALEAKEQLLVCYRVGKNPSEKLHDLLLKARNALHNYRMSQKEN